MKPAKTGQFPDGFREALALVFGDTSVDTLQNWLVGVGERPLVVVVGS